MLFFVNFFPQCSHSYFSELCTDMTWSLREPFSRKSLPAFVTLEGFHVVYLYLMFAHRQGTLAGEVTFRDISPKGVHCRQENGSARLPLSRITGYSRDTSFLRWYLPLRHHSFLSGVYRYF
ncbi:hypothetical protein DPMN_001861 [Dreissena polymorpha]|uniref:Uncharacterized protein n=1 Tax=Dreissena polymorpha TaxID=45954 RepID=A0A9D4RTF6_DREPO|nr:hypothetical protein DPMN_001861 [Dreissena polymorpha]